MWCDTSQDGPQLGIHLGMSGRLFDSGGWGECASTPTSTPSGPMRRGGVHTGEVIGHRRAGGRCPRCGTEMQRASGGGRTTWWCPAEQT